MSSIHYFQRYSQKENVVTNNTLLLLFRIYNESVSKFSLILNTLFDGSEVNFGIQFSQQFSTNTNSVPDGMISQSSLKIVVETKLYDKFSDIQLVNHLDAFHNENYQILLSLGTGVVSDEVTLKVKNAISSQNLRVRHISTTYDELIKVIRENLFDYEVLLNEMVDDYEEFCWNSNLLPIDKYQIRCVPCGFTLDENLSMNIYYEKSDRGYRKHSFIGLYNQKCIKAIGRIKNIVECTIEDNKLVEIDSLHSVLEEDKNRIIEMSFMAERNHGWDLSTGHRFFIVDQFHNCNFKKISKGGMNGRRYFDIRDYGLTENSTIEAIVDRLSQNEWN